MTPDYRALCAELADALAEWRLGGGPPEDTADADLIDRARTLLAEADGPAVPDGREPASVALQPSDGDLWTMYDEMRGEPGDWAWVRDFARAVLARWGRPTPQPVPLSERLPGPEDLNDKGECWEWDSTSDAWVLIRPIGLTFRTGPWLPANALPLPAGESNQGENNV